MNEPFRMWALTCAVLALQILAACALRAQETGQQERIITATVRGRVLNKITNEPIARALVTHGNEYATLTNDHGQFEFKMVERLAPASPGASYVSTQYLEAKKPGFLEQRKAATYQYREGGATEPQSDVTIYLLPEALIVGHVNVPGSEGDVRIECELYRRRLQNGRMAWAPAGSFTSWTESMIPMPGAPLFGYPPIYYPNTTDFSAATPIVVRAGETAQLNFSVARRQYYPVHIPVGNPPATPHMVLNVHPTGHSSPGWSLGYNPADEAIEGMLPDGTYTVEASTFRSLPPRVL
jgi:hypothetical protein